MRGRDKRSGWSVAAGAIGRGRARRARSRERAILEAGALCGRMQEYRPNLEAGLCVRVGGFRGIVD